MKSILARMGCSVMLLFLLTDCASKKSKIPFEKPEITENEEIYIPHLKSERKNFFKESEAEKKWVDSVYQTMSLDEKLGQLFMISAYSNKDSVHVNSVEKLIVEHKVGGVIFFQGGPVRQANLSNSFQSKSKIPLFIAIDAEWGLSMRLDSTFVHPWNMTLGAVQNLILIEKVGESMGKESKRMGVHFNFAPVLDINTNPKNPVIGFRSFGESKVNVSDRAIALMKGVQNQGVFSTGKHFPGHGNTAVDSHKALPLVDYSKEHIDLVELYPYKRLFDEGLVSVMVGHLNIPSLEPRPNYPTSISKSIVTELLQNEMQFDGLIFTDALNMKGVSTYRENTDIPSTPGDIDLKAFLAGNDILLCSDTVPFSIAKMRSAYLTNVISEERLVYSVKKILRYKFKAGLPQFKPIDTSNLVQDINPSSNKALHYQLFENAITVLENKESILPIKNLQNNRIAYVKLGDAPNSEFVAHLKKYTEITEVASQNMDSLNQKLKDFDTVIVGFHKSDRAFRNQDFTETESLWLQQIAKKNKVILDVFAKPYSLLPISNYDDIEGLVVSYQNSDVAQIVSAELIFGAIEAKGKLPVSVNTHYKVNDGLPTEKLNRLGFTAPENVGMSPLKLQEIEQIVNKAIEEKIAPGIVVLVARKGKVVYQKAFGYQTYDKLKMVATTDLYDVASLTKMIATLPNLMQQYDKGKVNLATTLATMLPLFKDSNKASINFKDLLLHNAQLIPYIPYYKNTLDSSGKPLEKYYSKTSAPNFSKQVADSMFIRNDFHDTIMKIMVDSKLLPEKKYKYSDLTFMILKEYLEKSTAKKLDVLVQDQFFRSLGMNYSLFNPLQKKNKSDIAPTEIDNYFRHQTLQGYVHDQGAAIEGGVQGHAGLFSNAMDIAKMMQLYLQKGNYGGIQYFSSQTFDDFNSCYLCAEGNVRGLGFNKPRGIDNPASKSASDRSFGHTGFTGTMTWADPVTETVYVFLSNRTYPEVVENKLAKGKIREQIQEIIYEAIEK
ncbi:glycoside hydrolase family 3 N-terminal domain-containing protein [Flavobacterium nackdongense]|uniref:beta-N-acetylhexosaminidase n=1 Tax=Flavobacterium nackdongense TaxID=2547394 RepID=A0A4P6YIB9_9FLAO|nr:glycoside hydrolase family 3 N-terminal domain-containing protein [Flavobacterium nackdongense]QBN20330.1 beta-N-acetylglucosaminidase [Flavobacterium nackdongense]